MKVEETSLPGVLIVTPQRFMDDRGFFSETWNEAKFSDAGIEQPFVQDNQSLSRERGVVRGLHCQIGPNAQGKLIRVIRGAIWDVAVDARTSSPTFGQSFGLELSSDNWCQLWIPAGFLHGFCTLETDTEVVYKVTAPYDRGAERGVRWDDPTLSLPWPIKPAEAILSAKDKILPTWSDVGALFK